MTFDLLSPPQGHRGWGTKIAVPCLIHVSISHTKFDWTSSTGLGEDSITDGRRRLHYPLRFFIKAWGK